jgi:hypothetical protein
MKLHDGPVWEALGRPDGSGWDFSHAFGWRTPFYMYLKNRDFARNAGDELSDAGDAYRRIELRTVPAAIVAWLLLSAALSEVIARTLA